MTPNLNSMFPHLHFAYSPHFCFCHPGPCVMISPVSTVIVPDTRARANWRRWEAQREGGDEGESGGERGWRRGCRQKERKTHGWLSLLCNTKPTWHAYRLYQLSVWEKHQPRLPFLCFTLSLTSCFPIFSLLSSFAFPPFLLFSVFFFFFCLSFLFRRSA